MFHDYSGTINPFRLLSPFINKAYIKTRGCKLSARDILL
jgi:hypothetical protein